MNSRGPYHTSGRLPKLRHARTPRRSDARALAAAARPASMPGWDVPRWRRGAGPCARARGPPQLLRRPRPAPRGDGRLLRAALAVPVRVPGRLAASSAIGRPTETSALLRDLSHVLPGTSAHDLARSSAAWSRTPTELGLIGGVGLLWSSLGFLSALESALNIIYGLPNRGFLRQKLFVFGLLGSRPDRPARSASRSSPRARRALARSRPGSRTSRPGGSAAASRSARVTTFLFLLLVYRTLPEHRDHDAGGAPRARRRDRPAADDLRVAAALPALRRGRCPR